MATNNAVNNSLTSQTGTGNFVGSTNPTITTPIIGQINDTNNNVMLTYTTAASAVNYITINNANDGGLLGITALGASTDISIGVRGKGAGGLIIQGGATSNLPFAIQSGTGYQHTTNFSFANTSGTKTVTFPDASGTVQLTGASSLITAPAVSSASTLALGTAYQNVLGYDVVLTIYVSVTAATAGSLLLGVGTTTTPTQQTIVSTLTVAAVIIVPVTIYLPNNYYALLSTGGTITAAISGQITMPV